MTEIYDKLIKILEDSHAEEAATTQTFIDRIKAHADRRADDELVILLIEFVETQAAVSQKYAALLETFASSVA